MSITQGMWDDRNYLDAKDAAKNSVIYNPTKDDFSYNFNSLSGVKSGTSNASLGFGSNYSSALLPKYSTIGSTNFDSNTGKQAAYDKRKNAYLQLLSYQNKKVNLKDALNYYDKWFETDWTNETNLRKLAFEAQQAKASKNAFWDLARNYEDNIIKDKELLGYTYNPADNSWTKPAGNPRSFNESYWLNRAKLFGFNSIDEVKLWQSKLGLQVDGMFGPKSELAWNKLNQYTSQGNTNINTSNLGLNPQRINLGSKTESVLGYLPKNGQKSSDPFAWAILQGLQKYTLKGGKGDGREYYYHPKFGRIFSSGQVYNPNTKLLGKFDNGEVIWNNLNLEKVETITPGKWANKTLNDLYNSGKFRKPYTGQAAHNITIAGKKYPVVVGVGKGDGIFADASFAYDLNSGKILRLQETTIGTPLAKELGNYGWVDVHDVLKEDTTPYFKPIGKHQQGGKMNNQEEMQKAFMAFLILDAAEQGMQIQSEQDLQAYAEQLGEEGIKAKYQEFMQKMQGLTPAAKYGAKLNYLKQLKGECPEGYEVTYFKEGGMFRKGCKICEAKKAMMEKGGDVKKKRNAVEEFKKGCKMKK